MRSIRRPLVLAFLFGTLFSTFFVLGGCQPAAEESETSLLPLFGNGTKDNSQAVAAVNGVTITELDLEIRFDEMDDKSKNKYKGPEGQRLLLREMMDEVILAQGAVELGLQNDHDIARTLISNRRSILGYAMRNLGILANQEPSEDDIQDHYLANRSRYKKKGIVRSRHVECLSQADADQVYARLMKGGWENRFTVLVKEHSVNKATAAVEGVLGWFNEGGYVPDIRDAKDFTKQAYALQDGINPPFASGGRWHVVEIMKREYDRGMTLAEARPTVLTEMTPGYQRALVDDYLTQARKSGDVRMLGIHAPGQGLSAEQLFGRARAVPDGELKMELFEMVFTDFPESDRADDALFLSANLALDGHGDRRLCAKLLTQILDDYPDSELIEDSRYLLQNMDNPQALNPTSIEELRR